MIFNILEGEAPNTSWMTWAVLGVLLVIIVAMMVVSSIRNKKRQQEAEDKLNGMRPGDKVKTIGGICGTIVEVDDETNSFVLETGAGDTTSYVRFDKVAVYQIEHPQSAEEQPAEPSGSEDDDIVMEAELAKNPPEEDAE
ncbi:MAG: preprotein translocase subunit YajC [Clostridia bacterium]|nr:preprotein translocase subunit YajC [Clostridia bacterium]